MKNFEPIYQLPWDEIGMSIIGFLLLAVILWAVFQRQEAKNEEKEVRKLFYTPEEKEKLNLPERQVKRYNKQLDLIEL